MPETKDNHSALQTLFDKEQEVPRELRLWLLSNAVPIKDAEAACESYKSQGFWVGPGGQTFGEPKAKERTVKKMAPPTEKADI